MQNLIAYEGAPFNGPFCGRSVLLDAIATGSTPYEGLWTPTRFAKALSMELAGTISSFSVQLYGTNADGPANTYKITIGGSVTTGDVVTATFKNPLLPGGSVAVSYTVLVTDTTLTLVAAGLVAAINATAALTTLGFVAANSAAVITITWPSIVATLPANLSFNSPSQGDPAPFTQLTTSLSGGATETAAVAAGSDGTTIGSAITALGITAITPPLRWVKVRVASGTFTSLSAYLAQTG